jgi:hypothetical protein
MHPVAHEATSYPIDMPLHANSVPADRYLVRLNGSRVSGWQLRIPARHPLGPMTHLFSDAICGSGEQAKEAARAMRDRMLERAGLALHPKGHAIPKKGRVIPSLPVGITLGISPSDKRALRLGWIAFWSENNRQHKRSFSIFKYGFEDALHRALTLRAEKTGLVALPKEVQAAMQLRSLANKALQDHPSPKLPREV